MNRFRRIEQYILEKGASVQILYLPINIDGALATVIYDLDLHS